MECYVITVIKDVDIHEIIQKCKKIKTELESSVKTQFRNFIFIYANSKKHS